MVCPTACAAFLGVVAFSVDLVSTRIAALVLLCCGRYGPRWVLFCRGHGRCYGSAFFCEQTKIPLLAMFVRVRISVRPRVCCFSMGAMLPLESLCHVC